MNLEELPNEILLDIFEYISSINLLETFSNLNHRFNNLLRNYFQLSILNFRSISKFNFNKICEENLSLIIEDLYGLYLSDDDDTPEQTSLFLSLFPLNQFVQLKFLSFYYLTSYEIIKKVVLQLIYLPHLTDLNFIKCHMIFYANNFRHLLNCIWRLSKLTCCYLDFHLQSQNVFSIPTIQSKSIKKLYLPNIQLDSRQINQLFEYTPNLQHLFVRLNKFSDDNEFRLIIKSINSLKFIVNHLTQGTIGLLRKMPNLTRLILQIGKHHMDGYKWKELILDYLPKLQIFRFLMVFHVNNEEEMNRIFESYRTSFWLIERQWFVRCHWNYENDKIQIYLYTLPYSFSRYTYILNNCNGLTKSTCPNENDYWSYDRVTTLRQYHSILSCILETRICFPNIRHLELKFPLSDQFLSIISQLDQLISLQVSSNSASDANIVLSQIQTIIDRSSRLYLLTIASLDSSIIQQLPFYLTSKSIRRLDLQSYHYQIRNRCFNNEQCLTFLRSSLAKQCEVIQIVIDNPPNIDHLSNQLTNLRGLKVVYQFLGWNEYVPTKNERIGWTTPMFSGNFTDNLIGTKTIRLWIR